MARRRKQATVSFNQKAVFSDGAILQIRIVVVPEPVVGSRHWFKYALFYGRKGERQVLYDNERLKGDHRHFGHIEEPYQFTTIEQLMRDFLNDIRAIRAKANGEPE